MYFRRNSKNAKILCVFKDIRGITDNENNAKVNKTRVNIVILDSHRNKGSSGFGCK